MKIVQFSRLTPLPCRSTCDILPPPRSWTSNFKVSPPSPNDNQSVKRKHDPRMTNYMLCYQQNYLLSAKFIIITEWI